MSSTFQSYLTNSNNLDNYITHLEERLEEISKLVELSSEHQKACQNQIFGRCVDCFYFPENNEQNLCTKFCTSVPTYGFCHNFTKR